MSELKTLKDIYGRSYQDCHCGEYNEGSNSCLRKDIKAEAVKWIKDMKEDNRDDVNLGVVNWIKQFFNLTEEDLKGEIQTNCPLGETAPDFQEKRKGSGHYIWKGEQK